MKKFIFAAIFLVITAVIFTRCYYDSTEYLYPSLDTQCDTTNVTYSVSVVNVLSQNCYSCHSNATAASQGKNIKLENYSDVVARANDGSLLGSVTHDPKYIPMPYNGGSLSKCDLSTLEKWISDKTPNN